MNIPYNKIITMVLLLLCIFVSLMISNIPYLMQLFRNSNIEGLESNADEYLNDVSSKLSRIEEIIQEPCDTTTDLSKKDKIKNIQEVVSKMEDSKTYSYKSDLKRVLSKYEDDDSKEDILKIIMDKIKEMRSQINKDRLNTASSKVDSSASKVDPIPVAT